MLHVHPEGDPGDNDEKDGGDVGLNLGIGNIHEGESQIGYRLGYCLKLGGIGWLHLLP